MKLFNGIILLFFFSMQLHASFSSNTRPGSSNLMNPGNNMARNTLVVGSIAFRNQLPGLRNNQFGSQSSSLSSGSLNAYLAQQKKSDSNIGLAEEIKNIRLSVGKLEKRLTRFEGRVNVFSDRLDGIDINGIEDNIFNINNQIKILRRENTKLNEKINAQESTNNKNHVLCIGALGDHSRHINKQGKEIESLMNQVEKSKESSELKLLSRFPSIRALSDLKNVPETGRPHQNRPGTSNK